MAARAPGRGHSDDEAEAQAPRPEKRYRSKLSFLGASLHRTAARRVSQTLAWCPVVAELATLLALAGAPVREAEVTVRFVRDPAQFALRGRTRTRRGDRVVLYMARRCQRTVAAARRRFVVAYNPRSRAGLTRFRAQITPRSGEPRRGRVCLMVATRGGDVRVQASARYARGRARVATG